MASPNGSSGRRSVFSISRRHPATWVVPIRIVGFVGLLALIVSVVVLDPARL